MRLAMPLVVLALAACDPPMEHFFPASFHSFDRDGIRYEARAQYDPIVRGWFVRVTSLQRPMGMGDLDLALSLAEAGVGPLVCEGRFLDVEPGEIWNDWAGDRITYLDGPDTWQMVGRCTDRAAPDVVVAVFPEGVPGAPGAMSAPRDWAVSGDWAAAAAAAGAAAAVPAN